MTTDRTSTLEHSYLRLRTMIPAAFAVPRHQAKDEEAQMRTTEAAMRALVVRHNNLQAFIEAAGLESEFETWLRRRLTPVASAESDRQAGGLNVWKEPGE